MADAIAPFSIDEFFAGFQRARATVRVCMRRDLLAEHAAVALELERVLQAGDAPARAAEALKVADSIEALEAALAAATREFVLEALGSAAWQELRHSHLPTDEQRQQGFDHNPLTFPAAVVAASCVAPVMTVEQAVELEQRLSVAQWGALWRACLQLNVSDDTPKSLNAQLVRRTLDKVIVDKLTAMAAPPAAKAAPRRRKKTADA